MPAPVKNVAWKCTHCGKRKWLKPGIAKKRLFCSRECLYESRRAAQDEHARARAERQQTLRQQRQANAPERECGECGESFRSTHAGQRFCSQACSVVAARRVRAQRSASPPTPRPCEFCGVEFTPRQGSAGRFCSRPCTYAGQSGSRAANFRGGRMVNGSGYVNVLRKDHPAAVRGYVLEHRLVMEQVLGRSLRPGENVHHINGDKADNRPENLELWTKPQPPGVRAKDIPHCPTCRCHET